MARKISHAEKMIMKTMKEKGSSQREIARLLDVDEKTVRYHLGREASGAVDGRSRQALLLDDVGLADAARHWWAVQEEQLKGGRPPSIRALHDWLESTYGYKGSYKSVRKWVRANFPPSPIRSYRRVETPPGAQMQIDWKEDVKIDIGEPGGPTKLNAFVMELSHSRGTAVVWSRTRDQLAWQHCHVEALKRLGGVAAMGRVDNCKTAVGRGSGAWGEINESYRSFANGMRFHVDACRAYQPNEKGKVERTNRYLGGLGIFDKCYQGLEHLQAYTDEKILLSEERRRCPATGTTIAEARLAEREFLGPLPEILWQPFDLVKTPQVHKDHMVFFEGRQYELPTRYVGKRVEAHGCSGVVQFVDRETGEIIKEYPRGTQELILLDPDREEHPDTDGGRVTPPPPLGRVGRKLAEIMAMPVDQRSVNLYAELAEVAR